MRAKVVRSQEWNPSRGLPVLSRTWSLDRGMTGLGLKVSKGYHGTVPTCVAQLRGRKWAVAGPVPVQCLSKHACHAPGLCCLRHSLLVFLVVFVASINTFLSYLVALYNETMLCCGLIGHDKCGGGAVTCAVNKTQ